MKRADKEKREQKKGKQSAENKEYFCTYLDCVKRKGVKEKGYVSSSGLQGHIESAHLKWILPRAVQTEPSNMGSGPAALHVQRETEWKTANLVAGLSNDIRSALDILLMYTLSKLRIV